MEQRTISICNLCWSGKKKVQLFGDFLQWYNNKDACPTLKTVLQKITFHHNKGIDKLKLACTLPNLIKICLHSSTSAEFYPLTDGDKDWLSKVREDVPAGPSLVFTRKTDVDETHISKSTKICKSVIGLDASQFYPYSRCQSMPTGFSTMYEFDTGLREFQLRQNKSRGFEKRFMSYFQRARLDYRIEGFGTTETQKKNYCFNADGFCGHCNTVFEALGCYYDYCLWL